MKTGIYFGGVEESSVKAQVEGIMQILSAPHTDEKTKQLALKVLEKGCGAPSHNSVTNCNLTEGEYVENQTVQGTAELSEVAYTEESK